MSKTPINWRNYIIEFFIVLLGVTIAFWLSNQSELIKEKKIERDYLKSLSEDLDRDIKLLQSAIESNEEKVEKFKGLIRQFQSGDVPLDTMAFYGRYVGNLGFFTPANFTYQSLEQSGDLKIIRDRELRSNLFRLQQRYDNIDEMQKNFLKSLDEEFFPLLYRSYDMLDDRVTDPEFFQSTFTKNYLIYTYIETQTHLNSYRKSVEIAENIKKDYLNN